MQFDVLEEQEEQADEQMQTYRFQVCIIDLPFPVYFFSCFSFSAFGTWSSSHSPSSHCRNSQWLFWEWLTRLVQWGWLLWVWLLSLRQFSTPLVASFKPPSGYFATRLWLFCNPSLASLQPPSGYFATPLWLFCTSSSSIPTLFWTDSLGLAI